MLKFHSKKTVLEKYTIVCKTKQFKNVQKRHHVTIHIHFYLALICLNAFVFKLLKTKKKKKTGFHMRLSELERWFKIIRTNIFENSSSLLSTNLGELFIIKNRKMRTNSELSKIITANENFEI